MLTSPAHTPTITKSRTNVYRHLRLLLYSQEDEHHTTAEDIFDQFGRRLTTNYVLAEYVALALIRGLPRTEVLAFSEEILDDDSVEIVWVPEDLHFRAVKLLRQRPDKRYSLCDAVSFLLMRERGETEALTTDRHFEQEGLVRLLAP